ncbi:hypothetical protein [Brachybacterium nesterenkovii]|uniref:Integral membrane transport protein n=1 Tax=Brachybacterium nesterenkovii TaxID=47847 RepID=A0A1X6WV27_9MICO|nr:hypothetical protein [Brachybacterium nesterenkovii]SLM88093.1 hypothetical protein FM110_01060 [Brachybacterium nesterenkovii]
MSATARATASPLAGALEVWQSRDGAPTRGDRLYLVYVAVLTVLVIGVPAGRTVIGALARPDVIPYLLSGSAPNVLTGAWLALCALLVLVGAVRGPALLTPFFTVTLASSSMPRRRALLRPFARALGALAALVTVLGALMAGTLVQAGLASAGEAAVFSAACAGAALLAGGAWLLGEIAGATVRRILAGALVLAGLAAALLPGGGLIGPGAALPGGSGAAENGHIAALVLVLAGLAAVVIGALRLNRVRGTVLLEQARRWADATTTAVSGDLAAAAGAFRALPTAGRRLPAIGASGGAGPVALLRLYARRDLVALARTPERTVAAVLGMLAAGAALALSAPLTGPVRWTLVAGAALVSHAAASALVDGARHGIATIGAPGLFGQSAGRQVLCHLPVPLLVAVLAAGSGALPAVLSGAGGAPGVTAAVLMAPLLVIGRVRDAAKGPMPLRLTMPMPTAQGDASIIPMLAWQADGPLLAIATGVLLALGAGIGPAAALIAAGAMLAVLGVGAVTRMRELQG